jgi:hypothetical protein
MQATTCRSKLNGNFEFLFLYKNKNAINFKLEILGSFVFKLKILASIGEAEGCGIGPISIFSLTACC